MKNIATKIFICASLAFGIIGITLVIVGGPDDNAPINMILMRMLLTCVFIILPSFALSVASKYLKS